MLSQNDLSILLKQAKNGDENAKELIFINNAPLIRSIIRRFKNKGIEYEDLYQIACIGFVKAITNFDEKFDVKFSTYSVPMIIGEIKRYIRDNGAVKVSRAIKILANKINRFIYEFQAKENRSPTIDELSVKFGISEDEVVMAIDSARMPVSIYDKFDDEEDAQELISKIPAENSEDNVLDKIRLKEVINDLNDRERKIIVMRYYRDKTQSEIAEELGVSQVQISRLENRIIEKIRLNF